MKRPARTCAISIVSTPRRVLASARRFPGYRVGGKTGTAEKVVNGRYSSDKRFNAFLAAFPMDDPQYIVLSIIDEPKPEKPGMGATAGSNAAPIVATSSADPPHAWREAGFRP
jgi:cell division protein FtsI/penicillin-binding protein 2